MAASETDPALRDDDGGGVSPGHTAGWRSETVESGLAPPPPVSTVTATTRESTANTTTTTSSNNNNICSSSSNNISSNNNISSSSGPRGAEAPRPPAGEAAALEVSLSLAQLLLLVGRGEEVPGLRSRGRVCATGREPSAATAPRQPKPWHRPGGPAGGPPMGPARASGVDRQVRQRAEGDRSGRGPAQDAGGVGGPTQSGTVHDPLLPPLSDGDTVS
ncbi:peroxisomal biogenesis factor 39 [Lampetra fluviatilis]